MHVFIFFSMLACVCFHIFLNTCTFSFFRLYFTSFLGYKLGFTISYLAEIINFFLNVTINTVACFCHKL